MRTRTKILAWFMLIVVAALLLTVLLVAQSLRTLARDEVSRELEHQALRFRTFAANSTDPTTGKGYTDPAALLRDYLSEALPGSDETLFSVVNGQPGHRTRNDADLRLDLNPSVIAQASAATKPLTAHIQTAEGAALYSIIPVSSPSNPTKGALVIVEFLGPRDEHLQETIQTIALVALLAMLAAGAGAWFVTGRVLAPVRQVTEAAKAIDETDLTTRIHTDERAPDDDVSQLASTFNHMLDRIEGAFAAQRQFLDDAAHELRTPLTIIRAHLELPTHQRHEEQRALLLDEVDRMGRMVDDLLVLAKAERPDFLTRETIDLTDLVLSVAAKARLLADRQWGVPAAVGCTLVADGQRLTQALMQLATNAVASTRPGDTIHIASQIVGDGVELSVSDSGPGVPPEERESVFNRFHRGAAGQSTGLGLAIVSSIAQAHGGLVRVDDSELGGACFRIWLPAAPLQLRCVEDYEDDEGLP